MKTLTRDDLLARAKRRFRYVDLPDGGRVRIRSLTEREKSEYETATLSGKGGVRRDRIEDARRRLIVATVVDEDGNPLLQPADVKALAEADGAITSAIYNAAREHCGFDEGDVEQLAKNSESVPVDDSPSA